VSVVDAVDGSSISHQLVWQSEWRESMASIVTNCFDVAKSAFQIHGIDGEGCIA
jgi:hypothetical protein